MNEPRPAEKLARFVRLLRRDGYAVGVQETLDGLRVAGLSTPLDVELVRNGLRSLSCRDLAEWRRFDTIFDSFWFPERSSAEPELSAAARVDPRLRRIERQRGGVTGLAHAMETDLDADAAERQRGSGAGRQSTLARADFRFLADRRGQLEVERLAERLALRIRRRLTRRRRETTHGTRIHLRRTLRRSLPTGGLPLALRYLERRREPPRLVLLQDVSHSMTGYSPLLTRFVRGLMRVFVRSEAFVFHVRLYRITHLYRENDALTLKRRLESMNQLWMGGTRIADSLRQFNQAWSGRYVNSRTIVIIMSDACDTDDPEHLAEELETLKHRAARVVWLNPLLGRGGIPEDDFTPSALAQLDLVAPAHSLQGLERVADYLARQ